MGEGREPNSDLSARVHEHSLLGTLLPAPVVTFTFDGARVEGRDGEPIAAALFAAGVRIFRTMPRFGDARGGYCMMGRCPDCMVVVDGTPNIPACVTPLSAGLEVRTQDGPGDADWSEPGEPAE